MGKIRREHSDAEWSRLQKELIDSQIQNARNVKLTKEQVAQMRAEARGTVLDKEHSEIAYHQFVSAITSKLPIPKKINWDEEHYSE